MATGTLEKCALHGWIPVSTVPDRWQMKSCGWAVYWCQRCEQSAPWWRWGYGMGRHKLRTMNKIAFYQWQFECTEIPSQDPEAHCEVHLKKYIYICDQHIHICIQSCEILILGPNEYVSIDWFPHMNLLSKIFEIVAFRFLFSILFNVHGRPVSVGAQWVRMLYSNWKGRGLMGRCR
jgi:hypothetical protein